MSDEKPDPKPDDPTPRVGATRRAAMHRRSRMPKPTTVKLSGRASPSTLGEVGR